MRWRDRGFIVGVRKYGDRSLVLSIFTKEHGLRKGFTRLSTQDYKFQVGNLLDVEWSAKTSENLGYFKCELVDSLLSYCLDDSTKTLAIASISSTLAKTLPENEVHPVIYQAFIDFINSVKYQGSLWQKEFLSMEMELLSQLGFALDLSKCAVNNNNQNLKFISPKTGRAVSEGIGMHYIKNLLPLPKILSDISQNKNGNLYSNQDFLLGLRVIGYFLHKHLFLQFKMEVPNYREILMDSLR